MGMRTIGKNLRAIADPDFRMLWSAYAFSQLGVAFSSGAVAVIAIGELDATVFQVAFTLGAARLVAALTSVPVGLVVEMRAKRPLLIWSDLLRSLATIAIPVLLLVEQLDMVLLGLTVVFDMFLSIVATSAFSAHLKDLVPSRELSRSFARLSTTNWVLVAIFTPLGGLAIALVGVTATLILDAVTYVVSAFFLLRIKKTERPPSDIRLTSMSNYVIEATAGWRFIWGKRPLRQLFQNAILFGGSLVLVSPLLAVLVLRDLGLEAWHYTTILGVPAVGGVLGSAVSLSIQLRFGQRRTLLWFGLARTLWTVWIAFSPPGVTGFVLILTAEFLLMFAAGVFNPVFSTQQVRLVDDHSLSRVSAAWGATSLTVQPTFMIVGAILSLFLGLRGTIAVAGVLLMLSAALLPWSMIEPEEARQEAKDGDGR